MIYNIIVTPLSNLKCHHQTAKEKNWGYKTDGKCVCVCGGRCRHGPNPKVILCRHWPP